MIIVPHFTINYQEFKVMFFKKVKKGRKRIFKIDIVDLLVLRRNAESEEQE